MSIATEQHRSEEGSPKQPQPSKATPLENAPNKFVKQPQQQQSPWNQKVIDNPARATSATHVSKKSKLLTKQTPVASIESDNKGEKHQQQQQEHLQHIRQQQGQHELRRTKTLATATKTNSGLRGQISGRHSGEHERNPKDYRIYQNGQVNEFFTGDTNEAQPKSISDVCLVNDHFILVKMPSSEALVKESSHHIREPKMSNRKLSHYLNNKRNRIRKIAPINEEPEELEEGERVHSGTDRKTKSSNCLNVNSCWHSSSASTEGDVEIYQTRTKIHKIPAVAIDAQRKPVASVESRITEPNNNNNNRLENLKPHEIQSISGTILTSSQHDRVTLRPQASLVGSDSNNDDISYCRKSCSPQRRRRCPRFESFYWLLRPFGAKYRKPKPKIQAVVYKTYFVKWTKPPEIQHHGYGGVKSSHLSDAGTSVIRRCRSAIF